MLERLVDRMRRITRGPGRHGPLAGIWLLLDAPLRLIAPLAGAGSAALLIALTGDGIITGMPWNLVAPAAAVVPAGLYLRSSGTQIALAALYSTVLLLMAIVAYGTLGVIDDLSTIAGAG